MRLAFFAGRVGLSPPPLHSPASPAGGASGGVGPPEGSSPQLDTRMNGPPSGRPVHSWGGWDLNPRSSGYEPAALTSLATAPRHESYSLLAPSRAWDNVRMDAIGWLIMAAALVVTVVAVAVAPRLKRDNLRRQVEGGGGSFAGRRRGLRRRVAAFSRRGTRRLGGAGRDAGAGTVSGRQGSHGRWPHRHRRRRGSLTISAAVRRPCL